MPSLCTTLTPSFTENRPCQSNEGRVRGHLKNHQKCKEFIKTLILISLKSIFTLSLIIHFWERCWECRRKAGALLPMRGLFSPQWAVFLKLTIMIEHMKWCKYPILTYGCQFLFLGKCSSSQLFWNGLVLKKIQNGGSWGHTFLDVL